MRQGPWRSTAGTLPPASSRASVPAAARRAASRWAIGFAALGVSLGVQAASFSILGRVLKLAPPPQFCELGGSAAETAMLQSHRQNFSRIGALAHFVVPCDEVAKFRSGKIDRFTRWAMVFVPKSKGVEWLLVKSSREEFIRKAAGVSIESLDLEKINKRHQERHPGADWTASISKMEPLGTTKQAFFFEGRMTVQSQGVSTPILLIGAETTVNQLPVTVHVYTTPKATGAPPMQTASAYLDILLGSN
jgi:hypothetical protein